MEIDFNNLKINNLSLRTDFDKKLQNFIDEWFSSSKTVFVQTSGSTGVPKIFEVDKEKMQYSAIKTCDFLNLEFGDTALLCLPVEYISGKMMVVRSIIRNLKLTVSEPSLHPLKDLSRPIDFCAMTPLQVENSLQDIHWIRKLIIGGAAVSHKLKDKISQNLPKDSSTQVFETYGMSETLSHIALKEIYPNFESFFTVFDGVDISTDDRGCLTIYAPELHDNLLITNDLVEIKNKTQFRFLGRLDNVINSGGAKIFPEQLEALVKTNIDKEVVFVGINDESLGQKLIAVIEGEESLEITQKIKDLKFEKSYHKPKEVLFMKELPRTPNGKISRLELRKMLNND